MGTDPGYVLVGAEPSDWSFVLTMPDGALAFRIDHEGSFEWGEGVEPDDAARAFADALNEMGSCVGAGGTGDS